MRQWDLNDLAAVGDLADEWGVGKSAIGQWRRYPDFPAPLLVLSTGPVYSRTQIRQWRDRHTDTRGRVQHPYGEDPRNPRKYSADSRQPKSPSTRDRYDRITRDLRARIQAGEWPAGGRLPSRVELGAHYGVNPSSLAWVFTELTREGLLFSIRSHGTFVAHSEEKEKS